MIADRWKPQEAPSLSPWDVLIWKLDALDKRFDRLEERTEIAALRGEMGSLRGEMHQEFRGARHSFAVLELTVVLGFLTMLISLWLLR